MALAIQSGRVEASWVLTRLNSYSRRNKIYRAFRELGRILRTIYLLRLYLATRSCAERRPTKPTRRSISTTSLRTSNFGSQASEQTARWIRERPSSPISWWQILS